MVVVSSLPHAENNLWGPQKRTLYLDEWEGYKYVGEKNSIFFIFVSIFVVFETRVWFYTLIILATALFDKPAFKNLIKILSMD